MDIHFDFNYQKGKHLLTVISVAVALLLNLIPLEENTNLAIITFVISKA